MSGKKKDTDNEIITFNQMIRRFDSINISNNDNECINIEKLVVCIQLMVIARRESYEDEDPIHNSVCSRLCYLGRWR